MASLTSSWRIGPEEARARLDQFLARKIPDQSRSRIQTWIRTGQVAVNGAPTRPGYLVRSGDEVSLSATWETGESLPYPEALPLNLIYQDADLAVIDKPAGMVCHTGAGVRSGTLVNALLHHLGPLEGGTPERPGLVHRLDKQTSGVMVVARNEAAHRSLADQFKRHSIRKEYLALVHGTPEPKVGTIDLALGRDPVQRKKISVRARRKRTAVTHYAVEEDFGPVSLLRVRIETGRTHQIRVHLSQRGHPVVGDAVYGGRRRLPDRTQAARVIADLGRLFLHAERLEFRHPRTGEIMSFSVPLPRELQELLERLGS